MKRWRRWIASLLALLGAAGLLAYLWPFIVGGPPVSSPPPLPPVPAPPSPPGPVAIQGDVSISFDYSSSNGDVHIHTADGLYYDLQQVGEFTAVKSAVDNLEIQVRQGPWQGSSKTISTNIAVAMNVAGDRVAVYVGKPSIYVNGEELPITDQSFPLPKGGQIAPGYNQFSVIWPDQTMALVTLHGGYLDLLVKLADTREGNVAGLFGNFDKNPANDLTTRNGAVIAVVPTQDPKGFQRQLYRQFGNSWRIRQEDSLFTYPPGENTGTWTDLDFPYQIASTQSLDQASRQRAEDACKLAGITVSQFLENCILDVGLTGDAQFAQSTSQIEAAVTLPAGLECKSAPEGGYQCTDYQTSLPDARVGSLYQFTIETMAGNTKQVESFDCSLIDGLRRASCRIKTKGDVFDGSATVARYTLDSGETHEEHGVMRPH